MKARDGGSSLLLVAVVLIEADGTYWNAKEVDAAAPRETVRWMVLRPADASVGNIRDAVEQARNRNMLRDLNGMEGIRIVALVLHSWWWS